MMLNGVWHDNVTCSKCRNRHPAFIPCSDAKLVADEGRLKREAYEKELKQQREAALPSRLDFEQWYSSSHTSANLGRSDKGYVNETTRVAWRAWQAAAALSVTGADLC